jgi:hypothetical protein
MSDLRTRIVAALERANKEPQPFDQGPVGYEYLADAVIRELHRCSTDGNKHTLTLEQSVQRALNGEYTDQQIAAVTVAYRDAISAALSDWPELLDITAIDFWAIVEQVTDRPKPNRW